MYNFSIQSVSYESDDEYRETVIALFGSEEDFTTILDLLYFKTKDQPLFQVVYNKAASFMLSENQEIGLGVLFAFDYLPLFHQMLIAFNTLGDRFDDNHASYINLHKKLFS
jgi:hypothetical protein